MSCVSCEHEFVVNRLAVVHAHRVHARRVWKESHTKRPLCAELHCSGHADGGCHAAPPWLKSPAVGTVGVPPSTPVAEALAMTSATCKQALKSCELILSAWPGSTTGRHQRKAY